MIRHLLVALSGHGFGHAAQAAPVVNALVQRIPDLRVTLYTDVPRTLLASRFRCAFEHIDAAPDVGMLMDSALDVYVEKSARAYAEFHRHWNANVQREVERLALLRPDLVLADAPYRVLTAARRMNVPAVALCSLNWAAVYRHYCGSRPEADAIHAQIVAAYQDATLFLRPTPSMAMPELTNSREIGPIAWPAQPQPQPLRRRLRLSDQQRLVLVTLGGIPSANPLRVWPVSDDVRYVVPTGWYVPRPDVVDAASIGLHFADVLASVDVVITKPGYNTIVESVCQGRPALFVPRTDWPEQAVLVDWLYRHGRGAEIDRARFEHGDLRDAIEALMVLPPPTPVPASGTAEAAGLLAEYLN